MAMPLYLTWEKRSTIINKIAVSKKSVIIDVRKPADFAKGHAKGSRNIPLDELEDRLGEVRKMEKEIIVVCGGGTRNKRAHELLKQHGIDSTAGGSWKNYTV